MNFEDVSKMFHATEKTQAPILNRALSFAKSKDLKCGRSDTLQLLIIELLSLVSNLKGASNDWKIKNNVKNILQPLVQFISNKKGDLIQNYGHLGIDEPAINELSQNLSKLDKQTPGLKDADGRSNYDGIPISPRDDFLKWWGESEKGVLLNRLINSPEVNVFKGDADTPAYFCKDELLSKYLPAAMQLGGFSSDIYQYCSTLILRMNILFSDPRYDFLFHDYENFNDSLAIFLRYCFGQMGEVSYSEEINKVPFINYYKKESGTEESSQGNNHQIIIFDLSLLPSVVLENITALLGRLILEFLQRLGKDKSLRGKLPTVLILEEAHNYIPEKKSFEEDSSIAKKTFERIAKEGRKFGLSLLISSQRPSELSKTVMSQCNSFIVHRIQNPDDQKYIKDLVPAINQDILKQLPVLPQKTALVFGDCVRSPAQVTINEIINKPDSHDPEFFKHWISGDNPKIPFEDICSKWEGRLETKDIVGETSLSDLSESAEDEPEEDIKLENIPF